MGRIERMKSKKNLAAIAAVLALLTACGSSGKPEETVIPEPEEVIVITEATTTTAPPTETTTVPTTTTPEETTTTEPPHTVARESGDLVVLDDLKSYINQNSDTAGFIKVGGTMINYPVLQTDNNDYYMNHNFDRNSYYGGWIFADFRGVVNDYSQKQCHNIILYGHNQADGTMFGTLSKYKITKQNTDHFDFYLEHPTFEFWNLYHKYTYKIVAIFVAEVEQYQMAEGEEVFDYHNYVIFDPNNEKYNFDNWYNEIMARTEVITGVECDPTDRYVTLSTCSNEFDQSRLVVIGRRTRQDETDEVDTSLAKLNPDPKEPNWDHIYGR